MVQDGRLQEGEGTLWQPFTCAAEDGLTLFARDYPGGGTAHWPIVCLPGLARTSADFHELAVHLSRDAAFRRRVLALDYRGRGRSGRDPDWRNYDVMKEAADVLTLLVAAGVERAIVIGTSRGGLVTMAIGVLRPALLRGVVMNDIGPVIDGQGIARIRRYIGKLPTPASFEEGSAILQTFSNKGFPALSARDWLRMAQRTWKEEAGRLVPDYDPALLRGLASLDLEKPLPILWGPFAGLTRVPLLSIRGEHSDLFSAETQAEMARRHPRCTVHVAPGQAHAPLLADLPTLQAVSGFVAGIDVVH